ncbi:hypothetical protein [Nostoc sp. 'Lobaria pulmonaria (5183) cyanobiont']|uniref:hypothetical protein n=1 Tax=Nostoc sp. 'Lobaria pulmonaria (5183) cyanobiont' TaxID=1618022 RepID=UPI001319C87D|nr:hypothetical protein [Nostoc sp. 'Lobaria pulmonaria (5183) cyanobiont']
MSYKKLRNIVFTLHRILGFAIAPIAILLGLTGSCGNSNVYLDQCFNHEQI